MPEKTPLSMALWSDLTTHSVCRRCVVEEECWMACSLRELG